MRWGRSAVLGVAILLVAATFRLQILQGARLGEEWRRQVHRQVTVPAPRGEIRDRDGVLLAGSRLFVDVWVEGLELDAARKDGWWLDLDVGQVTEILAAHPEAKVRERSGRFYPFGRLLSHVIGYTAPIGPEQYEALRGAGYRLNDRLGATGLEAAYETTLRGRPGRSVRWTVPGRGAAESVVAPMVPGGDLELTISVALQIIAYESLVSPATGEPQDGVVIIADPTNGDILAMVSRPSYDPEPFLGPSRWSSPPASQADWGTEFISRATQGVYPPASIFKVVGAAVALQDLGIDPYKRWNCKGWVGIGNRVFKGWKEGGLGWLDLIDSLAWSCDETFYYLALEMGGAELLAAQARRFGFGEPVGLPLPEAAGLVPDAAWQRSVKGEGWYTGHTANMIIGQGDMLATPIQLVAAYQAIANPDRIPPRLVRRAGGVVQPVRRLPTPISPRTREIIDEGLLQAVVEGTARRCCPSGTRMRGKTGTAQTGENSGLHGSFIGYGEIEVTDTETRPIMVFVLAEFGGSSSVSAVPIARRVLTAVRDHWRAVAGVG
ncbi:hypothetical protein IIA16_01145 [bacterium]|nr:hypothetical protein [bacterium]